MIRKKLDIYTNYEILNLLQSSELTSIKQFELEFNKDIFSTLGIKALVDLAQIFFLKIENIYMENNAVIICMKRLDKQSSFHHEENSCEKYGTQSEFFNIDKTKEFSFLYYYLEALKFIGIDKQQNILNIGVNKGDEFSVIKELLSEDDFKNKNFLGIDYSKSIIKYAKEQFIDSKNVEFICADINKLDAVKLNKYDLIISIGTLQSSNINFNAKFMELFQNYLQKGGAIVFGFPNCRWIDGEMVYGAKAPNYSFNEMGLVLKDIHFCKKYLQQKGYRVVITGKDYLFLSARKIKADAS
ncbi:MAG: class I SAM-dependent methyltransferase [Thiovulaceae bacterium]|nr:class I SAM-dependent methyltransferase [Sulfurimonadaceae bacterium]